MENYHIMDSIGEGQHLAIFKCRRKYTNQFYTMKRISKMNKTEKEINKIRQEIDILGQLSPHPNIIQLIDSFENDFEFCIITEYAQYDLQRLMTEDRTLPESFIRNVGAQLVLALHYIHSRSIVHRNVKPENILIGWDGNIKLSDFSHAKVLNDQQQEYKRQKYQQQQQQQQQQQYNQNRQPQHQQQHQIYFNQKNNKAIKGSPIYSAPEILQRLDHDQRSDIWSLGIILYELCAGFPPWSSGNIYSLAQQVINSPLKLPTGLSPKSEFANLVQILLEKDQYQRIYWPDLLYHSFFQLPEAIINTQQQLLRKYLELPQFNNYQQSNIISSLQRNLQQDVKSYFSNNSSDNFNNSNNNNSSNFNNNNNNQFINYNNINQSNNNQSNFNNQQQQQQQYIYNNGGNQMNFNNQQLQPPKFQSNTSSNSNQNSSKYISNKPSPVSLSNNRPSTPQILLSPTINLLNPISTPNFRPQRLSTPTPNNSNSNSSNGSGGSGSNVGGISNRPNTPSVNFIYKPSTPSKLQSRSSLPPLGAVIKSPPSTPMMGHSNNNINNNSNNNNNNNSGNSNNKFLSANTPPTPKSNFVPTFDRLDIESSSSEFIDSLDYWNQQEQRSRIEIEAIKMKKDRETLHNLLTYLKMSSNNQNFISGSNVVITIIRTYNNLILSNNNSNSSTGGNSNNGGRPSTGNPNRVNASPPTTPSSLNNKQSNSSEYLFKKTFIIAFINLLSTLATTQDSEFEKSLAKVNLMIECIHTFVNIIELSPPLHLTISSNLDQPSSPIANNNGNNNNNDKKKVISSTALLLSILNFLTRNITNFDNLNLKRFIIKLLTTFFKKMGESAIYLGDVYKNILEGTEILQYLCYCIEDSIRNYNEENEYNYVIPIQDLLECLVSFIHTSPKSTTPFPHCNRFRDNYIATNKNNNSNYQDACFFIGNYLAKEDIIDWFYLNLAQKDYDRLILQIILHSCRSSKDFIQKIDHKERQLFTLQNEKNDFEYLSLMQFLLSEKIKMSPICQSTLLLALGTIISQYSQAVEWIIGYKLEFVITKFFNNTENIQLSSCASFFISAFLTEATKRESSEVEVPNAKELISVLDTIIESISTKFLRKILAFKKEEGCNTLLEIEGGCFGYPFTGLLDGCACIIYRLSKRNPEFLEEVTDRGIWEALCHQLSLATSEFELSPSGMIYTLRILFEVLSSSKDNLSYLIKNNLMISLCELLQPAHLDRILDWPNFQYGGTVGLCAFVNQMMCIIYLPQKILERDNLFDLIRHYMMDNQFVQNLIHVLPYLPLESLEVPIGLLSTLVLEDIQFCQQMATGGGLNPDIINLLLSHEDISPSVVADTLLIVNQIARNSSDHFKLLEKSCIFDYLPHYMVHQDPNLRAKACVLIGNLCKHNDYFYPKVKECDAISALIERCDDVDTNTRKSACFALGNAAFHSDLLYHDLESCIEVFDYILRNEEEDEKTRANVAGALGNLVRNSNLLCDAFINSMVFNTMLKQLENPALAKNILFSLGHICTYSECRVVLLKNYNIRERLDSLEFESSAHKYLLRIEKLLEEEDMEEEQEEGELLVDEDDQDDQENHYELEEHQDEDEEELVDGDDDNYDNENFEENYNEDHE